MRERLFRERVPLSEVLARAAELESRGGSLDELAKLYQALRQFEYVREGPATLSIEKELQQATIHAHNWCYTQIKESLARGDTDVQWLPQSQREHLNGIAASLGPEFSGFHGDGRRLVNARSTSLTSITQEIDSIFAERHHVGTAALVERCERLYVLTTQLRTDTPPQERSSAKGIANAVLARTQALRHELTEHATYAAAHYPAELSRGKVSRSALERTEQYLSRCVTVDGLLQAICDAARAVPPPPNPYANTVIIGLRCDNACDDLAKTMGKYGTVERFALISYLTVQSDEKTVKELLAQPRALFGNRSCIVYQPRTYLVTPLRVAAQGTGWNLDLVQAPQAWDITGGEGASVAVIDTGIDYRHPDLKDRFTDVIGKNFCGGGLPLDDNGHGTHVAGTIAGATTGVAPRATLYAGKVLDMNGVGSEVTVLQGFEWAVLQGADVINLSLGSLYPSPAEADAIAEAVRRSIAVCAAAGNDSSDAYSYPASHPGAISVAAVDRGKRHADFSNYNDRVAIAAPGVGVYSTWIGGYETLSGTSMATPHVSGVCALLASRGKKAYREILQRSAEDLGNPLYYGAGLLRAAEALK